MRAIDPSTITTLVNIGTGVWIVLIAHLIHRTRGRYTYTEARPGPDDPVVFEEMTSPDADKAGESAAVTDQVIPATTTDTQTLNDAEETHA